MVKLQEALDLREQGIKKPILLMAPFDERDLQLAVSRDIMPMVYTPIGDVLERESRAARAGRFRFTSAWTPASAASVCRTGRRPR